MKMSSFLLILYTGEEKFEKKVWNQSGKTDFNFSQFWSDKYTEKDVE